jgi:hypothetical protein
VKLLATRCQLAAIIAEHGHKLPDDADVLAGMRDTDIRLPVLQRIFALAQQSVIQATDRCLEN